MTTAQTDWIAVDWGTTNVRAWLMDADGHVIAQRSSPDGMGRLSPKDFEPVLLSLVGGDLVESRQTPVLACGMVGARQGWVEVPYVQAPCRPPSGDQVNCGAVSVPRLDVTILPGVSQDNPADVMRGEETQIAGLLALKPGFEGVVCLPGTHTKWVRVSEGKIRAFTTFMTGERFALLSRHSVLRYGLGTDEDWDEAAFLTAVTESMDQPLSVDAALFSIRAAGLLHGLSPAFARARLSGLLLGSELTGARDYWQNQNVALVGCVSLTRLYQRALAEQGVSAERIAADKATLAGLKAAFEQFVRIPA